MLSWQMCHITDPRCGVVSKKSLPFKIVIFLLFIINYYAALQIHRKLMTWWQACIMKQQYCSVIRYHPSFNHVAFPWCVPDCLQNSKQRKLVLTHPSSPVSLCFTLVASHQVNISFSKVTQKTFLTMHPFIHKNIVMYCYYYFHTLIIFLLFSFFLTLLFFSFLPSLPLFLPPPSILSYNTVYCTHDLLHTFHVYLGRSVFNKLTSLAP